MEVVNSLLAPIDAVNSLIAAPLGLISSDDGFLTFDKAKYLFCTLLCYALALVYRMLPNKPTLKVRFSAHLFIASAASVRGRVVDLRDPLRFENGATRTFTFSGLHPILTGRIIGFITFICFD